MSNALADLIGKGKSRRVKHRTLTAEKLAVLERQADLLAQLLPHKTLARDLQISRSFVSQLLSRLVQERRGKVPRLTHIFSLREGEMQ